MTIMRMQLVHILHVHSLSLALQCRVHLVLTLVWLLELQVDIRCLHSYKFRKLRALNKTLAQDKYQ